MSKAAPLVQEHFPFDHLISLSYGEETFRNKSFAITRKRLFDNEKSRIFARLGAILLDRGDVSKAAPLVEQSALRLQGEGLQGGASQESWATGEAQFTLSLLRLMQLMPYQVQTEDSTKFSSQIGGPEKLKNPAVTCSPIC